MNPVVLFREKLRQLFHIHATSHAIAVGVAIGTFFGFVPLWGLKTMLALAFTWLMGGSLVAAAIAVTIHDFLLPFAPLFLIWEYNLGHWILSHPHVFPPALHMHHLTGTEWLQWSTFLTVGRHILVGSIVIAIPFSVAGYFITRWWVERHRKANPLPTAPPQEPPDDDAESP